MSICKNSDLINGRLAQATSLPQPLATGIHTDVNYAGPFLILQAEHYIRSTDVTPSVAYMQHRRRDTEYPFCELGITFHQTPVVDNFPGNIYHSTWSSREVPIPFTYNVISIPIPIDSRKSERQQHERGSWSEGPKARRTKNNIYAYELHPIFLLFKYIYMNIYNRYNNLFDLFTFWLLSKIFPYYILY